MKASWFQRLTYPADLVVMLPTMFALAIQTLFLRTRMSQSCSVSESMGQTTEASGIISDICSLTMDLDPVVVLPTLFALATRPLFPRVPLIRQSFG